VALRLDDIYVSPDVNHKLNSVHGLSRFDVQDALENDRWGARWAPDSEGVERLLLFARTTTGAKLKISLYPTGTDGQWNLGTAFPVPG
jgi:hypothetical protein